MSDHLAWLEGRRAVITGGAGFLGSHLCERLVAAGLDVHGVDCFTDYYPEPRKRANLRRLMDNDRFTLHRIDLARDDALAAIDGSHVIFHLAAQAGVRPSYSGFASYLRHNLMATQKLLEKLATIGSNAKVVYASSSSVYGTAERLPTHEGCRPAPVSPYGVTKLATEHLARSYQRTTGLPVVGLRFFTVYGPRQRPDMAFSRFIAAAQTGRPVPLFGDGRQQRDFTYVSDAVDAMLAAATRGVPGRVYNVGAGRPTELREVIEMLGDLMGRPIPLAPRAPARGDARATCADGSLAQRDMGFEPRVGLEDGLARQIRWATGGRAQEEVVALAS